MDYEDFVAQRTASLRDAKGVSARDMSLSIGQNANYINVIENRKGDPSLKGLIYIWDYFGITPQEFFDTENLHPTQLKDLIEDAKLLNEKEMLHISGLIKEIVSKRK